MRSRLILPGLLALALACAAAAPIAQSSAEYGPPKGTLLIVGGGNLEGTGIQEKFIELAGGADAKIVVVPTAGGNRNASGELIPYAEEEIVRPWVRRGVKQVRMLHTHDPKVADTEAFVKDLRDATGVWFNGGRRDLGFQDIRQPGAFKVVRHDRALRQRHGERRDS